MLAMDVNENACLLAKRGVLETIASKLAPTGLVGVRSICELPNLLWEPSRSCSQRWPEMHFRSMTVHKTRQPQGIALAQCLRQQGIRKPLVSHRAQEALDGGHAH